jgi:diazepam-binding inhibitor (GABA receptor modulating acyl-CoA-binding protein)
MNDTELLTKFTEMSNLITELIAQSKNKQDNSLNIDDDMILDLYAHYKQATIGDCNIQQPSFLNVKEYAKYNAWMKLKDQNVEESMKKYIKKVEKINKQINKKI